MTSTVHQHRWPAAAGVTPQGRGIYLIHGIGEHAGRYQRLAQQLSELGYDVGAHDHPGHGKSAGKRGVLNSEYHLEETARAQLNAFSQETDATPILFGHSLGGLVAASMVLNLDVQVAGLILSAPAFAPFISPYNKLKLRVLNFVAPKFTQQLPYKAHFLTHDEEEQQRGRADPLNHRYKSASIVTWLVSVGKRTFNKAPQLSVPTLVLIAGEDVVVNPETMKTFVERAPKQFITERTYADFRHEILNETADRREQVHSDIKSWLANCGLDSNALEGQDTPHE